MSPGATPGRPVAPAARVPVAPAAAVPIGPAGSASPPGTLELAAGAATPAPGTISLRFIVRVKETGAELPAGAFEVRLLALDPVRGGKAGKESGAETGPGPAATVSVDPAPAPAGQVGKAPAAAPTGATPTGATPMGATPMGAARAGGASGKSAPGPTYQGAPEQLLVTQPDGSKRTFLAGVKPGDYAMRITAKGRRMLLEVLTVRAEDKLVERTLERE